MRTKEEIEAESRNQEDRFTIKATPKDLIIRCVSIEARRKLDTLCKALGLDLNKVGMTVVHSREEWEEASQQGKKCYLYCSMRNFRFVGNLHFVYGSGPVHQEYYIYKDKNNNSNAMIVLDFEMDSVPELPKEEPKSVKRKSVGEDDSDEFMFHPAKLAKGAGKPQHPVYNKETCNYELRCSICGNYYPDTQVSYTYSREAGYTYMCSHCNPSKKKVKVLSYKEKLAKACRADLDEYTFDGRSRN